MTDETFADRLARQSIEAAEAQKGITVQRVDLAGSIVIRASDGRDLLAIHQDGTVTGTAEDASEAASRFFEHLRAHVSGHTVRTQRDRYRAAIERARSLIFAGEHWAAYHGLGATLNENGESDEAPQLDL